MDCSDLLLKILMLLRTDIILGYFVLLTDAFDQFSIFRRDGRALQVSPFLETKDHRV